MTKREIIHTLNKLGRTIRMLTILFFARMFGEYVVTVSDYRGFTYAKYRWRGKIWGIPTTAVEDEQ